MEGNKMQSHVDWYDWGIMVKNKLLEHGFNVTIDCIISFDEYVNKLMDATARLCAWVDITKLNAKVDEIVQKCISKECLLGWYVIDQIGDIKIQEIMAE